MMEALMRDKERMEVRFLRAKKISRCFCCESLVCYFCDLGY